MEEQKQVLNIFFLPFLAQGHIIPIIDIAKLFSNSTTRCVKSTIVTTPLNAIAISNSIRASKHSSNIHIKTLDFPKSADVPEGIENFDQCNPEMKAPFIRATTRLQEPLERLIGDLRPDCIVADFFFPWVTTSAAKFNIPRLYSSFSVLAKCAEKSINLYKPFLEVASDSEPFLVPTLPHEIKFTPAQLPPIVTAQNLPELCRQAYESDSKSYGVIFNSFYDLEGDYINHYKKVWNQKAWTIGPISLRCNKDIEEKSVRGKKAAIDENECLKWLDSQKPNSVIYVCFGSETNLSSTQSYELAVGLEASKLPFIWVVRRKQNDDSNNKWLPEGFEERIKGRGLIIRGWAPQLLILDHEAVGGFVTHCGWNSVLEGICSGVPMVTWPVGADHFYHEKLVTDVLKIGASVGVDEFDRGYERIKSEVVEKAVKAIMLGEQGEEMRRRAKELKVKAYKAVEEGGSSYDDLNSLIEELCALKSKANQDSK